MGPAGHRSPFSLGGVGAAAYWPQDNPPTDGVGPAAPTNRAGGARKRRGDGETRRPFERKVATRKFAPHSGRMARAKDLIIVAEFLGVEKDRWLNETSEDYRDLVVS